VIDANVRVSLVIKLLTIDARIVVASVDTYLCFAEAVNGLDPQLRRSFGLVAPNLSNEHLGLLAGGEELDDGLAVRVYDTVEDDRTSVAAARSSPRLSRSSANALAAEDQRSPASAARAARTVKPFLVAHLSPTE
jgi:gas vesicle structural protein